jgi:hypothetical protein
MTSDIVERLKGLSVAPSVKEAFDAWLRMDDALAFIKENVSSDKCVIYADAPFTFIRTVLVKSSAVHPPDSKDLISWELHADSSWEIWTTGGNTPTCSISQSLESSRTKTFRGGEQLVFHRHFEGRLGEKGYYEILQKFVHVFDLHFINERNAYCTLNDRGDVEEVIKIVQIAGKGSVSSTNIVIGERKLLDRYAALTEMAIVCMFDFTRFKHSSFSGWANGGQTDEFCAGDLMYKSHIEPGYASYIRGVQIIRTQVTKEQVAGELSSFGEQDKQYVAFLAQDWKNGRLVEISCAPGQTANYFTVSDLPFELSPAFFRPDVLLKYKADSEKYQIRERRISCRGGWELKGYDINDAGQVYAYIGDLRHLPHEEQLHWKAYNEEPKGPISKRAYTADFEGKWDLGYDPLVNVKLVLHDWNDKHVPWWTLRNDNLFDRVHYPVTTFADEWASELLQLDQLVVEGFEKQWLKQQVISLGKTPDEKVNSLKLIEEFLVSLGFEPDEAKNKMKPFKELHFLRSILKSHAPGKEAIEHKQAAIAEHGSYKGHFRNLCSQIDEALKTVGDACGTFDAKQG